MDLVLATGQRREITQIDIQLFDGIGWNIRTGDTSLETIYTEVKTELAQEIISTANEQGIDIKSKKLIKWANGNDKKFNYARKVASILTPEFVDENHTYLSISCDRKLETVTTFPPSSLKKFSLYFY